MVPNVLSENCGNNPLQIPCMLSAASMTLQAGHKEFPSICIDLYKHTWAKVMPLMVNAYLHYRVLKSACIRPMFR